MHFNKKTRKRVDSSPSPGSADVSSAGVDATSPLRWFNHKDHREALINGFLRQGFFVFFVSFVVDLQCFSEISSRKWGSKHVHSNRIPCSVLVC